MKKLIYLALCLTTITNAQTSVGLSAGVQSWQDECSTSELLGEGSVQFYQGFNKYLGMRLTANAGYLKNVNIPYNTNYVIGNFDFMINTGPVFGFKDKYYQFQPFIGSGYGKVESQNLFNVHGGLLQKVKLVDRLWLSLELSRRGYLSANPLGGHQGNLRGVSAIQDVALVGLIFDFVKRKPEPPVQTIILKEITRPKPIDKKPDLIVNCNDCHEEYCIGYEHMKTDVDSEQYAMTLKKFVDEVDRVNAKIIQVDSWACNHGSDKLNCDLSEERAEKLKTFLKQEFKKRSLLVSIRTKGHCKDQEYANMHIQMRSCLKIIE